MDWVFEGIGTLLIGILLGVSGDQAVMRIRKSRAVKQLQKAGDRSIQIQAGRDVTGKTELDG